jgi:hypothetical protein
MTSSTPAAQAWSVPREPPLVSGQAKVNCAANTAVRRQRSATAALVGREGKLTSDLVRTPVALKSQKNHKKIQAILILVHVEGGPGVA